MTAFSGRQGRTHPMTYTLEWGPCPGNQDRRGGRVHRVRLVPADRWARARCPWALGAACWRFRLSPCPLAHGAEPTSQRIRSSLGARTPAPLTAVDLVCLRGRRTEVADSCCFRSNLGTWNWNQVWVASDGFWLGFMTLVTCGYALQGRF